MNSNPKRSDVEGIKTIIACMAMTALENKLEKGQKDGDATKVTMNGGLEVTSIEMPSIDAKVEGYEINSEGIRKLSNGKTNRTSRNIGEEDRKMHLARIREQRGSIEQTLSDER